MDAVVLVGGQGTRLRPLTVTTPKALLPAGGVPFLTHLLVRARDAGVDHVILSTSYEPKVFEAQFGDGSSLGLEITYVGEREPLGTGGGIRNVATHIRGDDFLVFNGDVLSALDVEALVQRHRGANADVTLHLTPVDDPRAFGLVPIDSDGRVNAFVEKPEHDADIVTDLINAGCYVFATHVLDRIATGRAVSVERETFPELLGEGARVFGHVDEAYWLDVGTPESFVQGSADLVLGEMPSAALPGPIGDSLVLRGSVLADDAVLTGGTTVGRRAKVRARSEVEGSVLFDDADVGADCVVRWSVIGAGAKVGAGCVLEGVVIGDGAQVGANCELLDGVRVWPGVVIPEGGLRFSSDR